MGLLNLLHRFVNRPKQLPVAHGSLADLHSYVGRLIRSPNSGGTLVIQIRGAEAFIQFTGGSSGVEMDFPLVTPDQKAREPIIRAFCDRYHLRLRVSFGTDGSGFLDVDLAPDVGMISTVVRAAFAEIFDVREPMTVDYLSAGLAVAV